MHLTDALLQTLTAHGQRQRHSDAGGFYIEVPASANPSWRVNYHYAGQEKSLSLGVYPTISLKQARPQRDDLKRRLDQGVDPSLARKATRSTGQSSYRNSWVPLFIQSAMDLSIIKARQLGASSWLILSKGAIRQL